MLVPVNSAGRKGTVCVKLCLHCNDCRWVCEVHTDRPWLLDNACTCGAPGMPCQACNRTDEGEYPALQEGVLPNTE